MTPKQKADYIIQNMALLSEKMSDYSRIELPTVKIHALFVVNEIIRSCPTLPHEDTADYWIDVRRIIEAM